MHYPQIRSILEDEPEYAEKFAEVLSDEIERWSPRTAAEPENLGWNNEDWRAIRRSLQNVVEYTDQSERSVDKRIIQGLDEVYDYVTKPGKGYRIEFNNLMSESMDKTIDRYELIKSPIASD